ncbi:T-cell immunoglobulin and mucin domain-containing protein 4 isoform X3 [Saimiri boliviensis]|uniref:T-cell immunoglobulin and mucin domain-containing protein 4 isoform X3 n=1 Tax=Saimiri boliviensis TaxID=27679 RepID=UPI003D785224
MSKETLVLWLVIEFWGLYLTPATSEIVVMGFLGQPVTLPCLYPSWSQDSNSMCWGKGQCPNSGCNEELIHTDGMRVTSRRSEKYRLWGTLQRGNVSLTILNPSEGDSGVYCCRIEVPGWFNDVKLHRRLQLQRESETVLPSDPWSNAESTSADTVLLTSKESKIWDLPSTSHVSMWKTSDSVTSPQPGASERAVPEQNKTTQTGQMDGMPTLTKNEILTSQLLMIIVPSLGFLLLALLVAFIFREKLMEINCLQRHTRLGSTGDSKNVLNDTRHGSEDEDGLFTL